MKLFKYYPRKYKPSPGPGARCWTKNFAWLPIAVSGYWIWLENYYTRYIYEYIPGYHGGNDYDWYIEFQTINPNNISTKAHPHRSEFL